jgi:tRNA pseudouridine55 synthase
VISGVINVYKEKGFTSHDVVAKLRGILKQKKIGHTGTLDPDATGVLPVCLGRGTKLCDMLTDKSKTYEAVMLLGRETNTQDTSGTTLKEMNVTVTEEEVRQAIMKYLGEYEQIPPMYSALKINGKKLYELAREGKEVKRKARNVQIIELEIIEMALPRVRIKVSCSKGTYIRTLCHDIGQDLKCGACMEKLIRIRVGSFLIKDSLKLGEIEEKVKSGSLGEFIIPVDQMFEGYTKVIVKSEYNKLIYNGNPFLMEHCHDTSHSIDRSKEVRVYDEEEQFIGIYKEDDEGRLYKPVKMFMES